MRWSALLLFTLSTLAQAQERLPNFASERVDHVYIDENLQAFPSDYIIKEFKYDKSLAKLVPTNKETHYYLENGQVLQIEFKQDDKVYKSYQYDEYGRIIQQLQFGDDVNMPVITFIYDDEKSESSEIIYRKDNSIRARTVLKYNAANQVIAKEEYRGKDKLNRFWLYDYNENGDLVLDQYFDAKGMRSGNSSSPIDSTYYTYNYNESTGKTIRYSYDRAVLKSKMTLESYADSSVSKTTYYQYNGQPNEFHLEVEKDSVKILVRGFYSNGDTTNFRSRFKEVFLDGDLVEYESRTIRGTYVDRYATFYEIDERGNWIKKITYSNGVILRQEDRTILY